MFVNLTDRVNSVLCPWPRHRYVAHVSVLPLSKQGKFPGRKKETANHAPTQYPTMAHLIIWLNCKRLVLSFLALLFFFVCSRPTLDKKRANF